MDNMMEVRRVRDAMSKAAEHDVRRLIAVINEARSRESKRIISPGSRAENVGATKQE